jgi:serine/threonine-protein kinase MRCK
LTDLQDRVSLQARDLQEAQTQRKLAVQEFTDVNEKVNELRSKNSKLSNDLLNKEDELEEFKTISKLELEKRDKQLGELRQEFLLLKNARDLNNQISSNTSNSNNNSEELEALKSKLAKFEAETESLLNEIKNIKEKHAQINKEQNLKFENDLNELSQSKNKELSLYQTENEKLNSQIHKLLQEKQLLEDELSGMHENKKAIQKYEFQMNEILTMLNDEKAVRSHLRNLATKLIEEVETLKQRTSFNDHNLLLKTVNSSQNLAAGLSNAGNGWKNRVSEKRDRINVQNMQVLLEKEFQAKEKIIEENQSLKCELDLLKSQRLSEMQLQIDELNRELQKYQSEIKELRNMNVMTAPIVQEDQISLAPSSTADQPEPEYQNVISNSVVPKQDNQTQNNKEVVVSSHKFEVVSFNHIEKCELCGGILYGISRQAIKCKDKQCAYLCHPKCRQYLPPNCPININQRFQLKAVDFMKGMGTLIQGHLKVPKLGGVKKGWQDNYVFLSNGRLFIYPIMENSQQKTSLIPSQIIDIRNPDFSVSSVTESDVIHANKRDIPCILKMIVTKLKHSNLKEKLLFCAKDENEKINWINVLKDLNERLKKSYNPLLDPNPIEPREIIDNTPIRNINTAYLYDYDRILLGSDEGIDVIDTRSPDISSFNRIYDKKTYKLDVLKDQKIIVAISGKAHQICLLPIIIIEGINAEIVKIEETKNCTLFCCGRLNINEKKSLHLVCVAVKKSVLIYEINVSQKPKYKKQREIELPMQPQSIQIIDDFLCVGLQSEFALYSLTHESTPIALVQEDRDKSLEFLTRTPTNALQAIKLTQDEYLLVFETLGLYVSIDGHRSVRRSGESEIMWPSKPLHVTHRGDYLLCYCDRGIDVFNILTGEWLQIIQFAKSKPLDQYGFLCLSNELSESSRLLYFKLHDEEEYITVLNSKNRSLAKSKYRKGSLSRSDEASFSTTLGKMSPNNGTLLLITGGGGSNGLNYSNSNVSSNSGGGSGGLNSRKSLISHPSNFQHIHHMGPSDGKSLIYSDNSSHVVVNQSHNTRRSMNSGSNGAPNFHIDKNDISGPTNFRHVRKGLSTIEDFAALSLTSSNGSGGSNNIKNQHIVMNSSSVSYNKSLNLDVNSISLGSNSLILNADHTPLQHDHNQNNNTNNNNLSIEPTLSSSSSASSNSNTNNYSPSIMNQNQNNTIKTSSSLYNGN